MAKRFDTRYLYFGDKTMLWEIAPALAITLPHLLTMLIDFEIVISRTVRDGQTVEFINGNLTSRNAMSSAVAWLMEAHESRKVIVIGSVDRSWMQDDTLNETTTGERAQRVADALITMGLNAEAMVVEAFDPAAPIRKSKPAKLGEGELF